MKVKLTFNQWTKDGKGTTSATYVVSSSLELFDRIAKLRCLPGLNEVHLLTAKGKYGRPVAMRIGSDESFKWYLKSNPLLQRITDERLKDMESIETFAHDLWNETLLHMSQSKYNREMNKVPNGLVPFQKKDKKK